jgi:hypothetical protein
VKALAEADRPKAEALYERFKPLAESGGTMADLLDAGMALSQMFPDDIDMMSDEDMAAVEAMRSFMADVPIDKEARKDLKEMVSNLEKLLGKK